VEGVAEAYEARGFYRGVDVQHACQRARLVADETDGMAAEARETAKDVLGPVFVHLEEVAVVDDPPDDVVRVVRLVRVVRDQGVELRLLPLGRIGRLREGRRVEVVLRQEREEVA